MVKPQMNSYKVLSFFDDIRRMKKINTIKLVLATLFIGMFFAGCSFKAELDSKLVNGGSTGYGSSSAYTPVLDGCVNESR
jgi:hypothetical protein